MKPRIVILGAGFGGLATALRLAKKIGSACEITLIDKRSAHLYTPLLYEVASGYLHEAPKGCVGELRSGICIEYDEYTTIIGMRMITFKRAEVKSVDKHRKQVELVGGGNIPYDYLVLALGSESEDYGIPGVREHAYALKTIEDALNIRKRLRGFIDKHLDGEMDTLDIVICGAGPSGIELASELAVFFERLRKAELIRHRHARVTVVDSGATILSMCDMTTRRFAETRLRALGIEVITQAMVKEVREESVVIGEKELPANMVIWTAGVKTSQVAKGMPFAHDERGRLKVLPTLLVEGEKDVFALGDNMLALHAKTGKPVPPLAQAAMKQGGWVADNIKLLIEGKGMREVQMPSSWPTVITLGGKYAVAQLGTVHIRGFLAYVLRKFADLDYFLRILPVHYALQLFWKGSRVYIKND